MATHLDGLILRAISGLEQIELSTAGFHRDDAENGGESQRL